MLVKKLKYSIALIIVLVITITASLFGQTFVGTIQSPGFVPSSIAIYEAGNKLFVSDTESEHLLIYDCTTLNLLEELDLGYPGMMVVHEPTGKLYLRIHIGWEGKIAVINADTNELIRFINDVYGTLRIDESLGKVYVLDRSLDGNLSVIDIATDAVSTVELTGGGFFSNMKVNHITHEIFIGYFSVGSEQLDIVDGTTLDLTTIPAPNGWDLAVNWLENKVYIIKGGLDRYWMYDRNTDNISYISECSNDATSLYFNSAGNRIYTSAEVNRVSTIIDGATNSCFNLPMHGATTNLAFRHATNHVYYVGMDYIVVMDDNTQLVEQFPNIWLKTTGNGIAIHQLTGRVFVNYYKNDPQASNTIVVLQDTETMIRPPVFVGDRGAFESYVLDPITKEVVEVWNPTYAGHGMAVRPGGGRVYEATYDRFSMNGSLREYAGCESPHLVPFNSFETGGNDPTVPVITPDGSQVYVSNSGSDNVSVIDTETTTVTAIISVGDTPWGAVITPDASKVYVANKNDNTVSMISTVSNTVIKTIAVEVKPWGVAVNPSGTKAYVANSNSGTVSVIDINSDNVIATIPVGSEPHWLACTPDGKNVYVTNSGSATVSVINTGSDVVVQTISVDANPEGIAAFPDGSEVYVATDSTVNVINTSDYSVSIVSLPVPGTPWLSHELIPLVIADPTSRFAGRVTSGGEPVNNAHIIVVQAGIEKGNAATNVAGDYSVFNLKSGTYDLEISASNYYPQNLTSKTVGIGRTEVLHFTMIPFTPDTPTLISPSADAENQPTTLTLNWNPATGADKYHLQVSNDSQFETKMFDDSTITTTSTQVGPLKNTTTYYWRVMAKNVGGSSDWSEIWNFTTLMQLPDHVVLISPPDDVLLNESRIEFVWFKSLPNVNQYWLEFSQNSSMINSVIDSLITDTTTIIQDFIFNQPYYWRVKAQNTAGWGSFSEIRNFKIVLTDIQTDVDIPKEYELYQNYPNPFNLQTTIKFELPQPEFVSLKVYNTAGQEVATLVNEKLLAGQYKYYLNAYSLTNGVYYYKFQAGEYNQTKKFILIK